MSEITVYNSTFLLAEESIFGTNKLHFFQGLQWSWVKVAINHRIGSKWRLSSLWWVGVVTRFSITPPKNISFRIGFIIEWEVVIFIMIILIILQCKV